jgi:hypothetical protein
MSADFPYEEILLCGEKFSPYRYPVLLMISIPKCTNWRNLYLLNFDFENYNLNLKYPADKKVPINTVVSSKRHFISWDYPFKLDTGGSTNKKKDT